MTTTGELIATLERVGAARTAFDAALEVGAGTTLATLRRLQREVDEAAKAAEQAYPAILAALRSGQEAEERLAEVTEAATALMADVRERYKMEREEKFRCPFMQRLEVAARQQEGNNVE